MSSVAMLIIDKGSTLFDVECDLVERNLDEHELAAAVHRVPFCVVVVC
jgi:hypothetical protein